ncbi:hypothetical protein K438DRAFT_1759015 [Mycena galopus ATCC 62051]|nr:hypothetical protein K438DRAFT_1759015 [Mycena galopus ATCC 62051]
MSTEDTHLADAAQAVPEVELASVNKEKCIIIDEAGKQEIYDKCKEAIAKGLGESEIRQLILREIRKRYEKYMSTRREVRKPNGSKRALMDDGRNFGSTANASINYRDITENEVDEGNLRQSSLDNFVKACIPQLLPYIFRKKKEEAKKREFWESPSAARPRLSAIRRIVTRPIAFSKSVAGVAHQAQHLLRWNCATSGE